MLYHGIGKTNIRYNMGRSPAEERLQETMMKVASAGKQK